MAEPFIGMVALVAFNFPPRGWAFCNGQIMSIAQNTALFSLLGTTPPIGAPVTAPGRSAEDIPIKRESREPKPAAAYLPMVGHDVAAPGGEMSMIRLGDRNTSRGISSPRTGTARGRGLNAETNPRRTSARGRNIFS